MTRDDKFRFLQYAYDANGRMLTSQHTDGSGYAASVYDGAGQRVQVTSNGYTRTYVYDLAGQAIAEYGSLGLERETIYRGGQAVATIESSGCAKSIALFVNDFFVGALGRQPYPAEQANWESRLTDVARQSYGQLLAEAKALGDVVFALYPHGARTNRDFVYDLYRSYLQREPDQGGWDGWTNAIDTGALTREQVRGYFSDSVEFANFVRRLCVTETANGIRYILTDHQGSARVVLDNSGGVISRHDYQPFGEEVYAGVGRRTAEQKYGASDQLRQRYALTERDEWTGLEHTWFRKYERAAGRWTSPDPYNGSMSLVDPQSLNRYSYVQNDPVNFVDPSGLVMSDGGFCGAQYSFEQCGGWGGITGGYFGGAYAEYQSIFGGIPEHARESYAGYQTQRDLDAFMRWLPDNAVYIGGLSWAWTDYSRDNAPSHIYTFNENRLSQLIVLGNQFAFDRSGVIWDVHGRIIGERGLDMHPATDPVSIIAGGLAGGLRAGAAGATGSFASRQLNSLLQATTAKGNYGLGSATAKEALMIGESWVGPGFRTMSSGRGMLSADGLRGFRFPAYKPRLGIIQANVERYAINGSTGRVTVVGNGHITIIR